MQTQDYQLYYAIKVQKIVHSQVVQMYYRSDKNVTLQGRPINANDCVRILVY